MPRKTLLLLVVAYIAITVNLLIVAIFTRNTNPAVNAISGLLLLFALFAGLLAIPVYTYRIQKAQATELREKEQQRIEAIIDEDLGKEVLGCIRVRRRTGSILSYSWIHEVLVITLDRMLVQGIRVETPKFEGGGTINHLYDKVVIPISEIKKAELTKFLMVKLNLATTEKQYKWFVQGLIPEQKGAKLKDYENILRQAFGDKLLVKK